MIEWAPTQSQYVHNSIMDVALQDLLLRPFCFSAMTAKRSYDRRDVSR